MWWKFTIYGRRGRGRGVKQVLKKKLSGYVIFLFHQPLSSQLALWWWTLPDTGLNISRWHHRAGNLSENKIPKSSNAEFDADILLINEFELPLSHEDETLDMCDHSPDPKPVQSQCTTLAQASKRMGLAAESEKLTTQLVGVKIMASPPATASQPNLKVNISARPGNLISVHVSVAPRCQSRGDTVLQYKVPGCKTVWVSLDSSK